MSYARLYRLYLLYLLSKDSDAFLSGLGDLDRQAWEDIEALRSSGEIDSWWRDLRGDPQDPIFDGIKRRVLQDSRPGG